jgi:methylmalonyl-CoA/ethylmalonyl-CoA epimerase
MSNPPPAYPGFGPIRQLGYIVQDLEAARAAWLGMGFGPWTLIRNLNLNCTYRGSPSRPLLDLAITYRGNLQIELIQQKNTDPSPYRAMIDAGCYGLNHIGFLSERIDTDALRAEALGMQIVCDIRMPATGRYIYFDLPELGNGLQFELLEASQILRLMFAQGARTAALWDGHDDPLIIDLAALPSTIKMALARLMSATTPPINPPADPGGLGEISHIGYRAAQLDTTMKALRNTVGGGPWQRQQARTQDGQILDLAQGQIERLKLTLLNPAYQKDRTPAPDCFDHIGFTSTRSAAAMLQIAQTMGLQQVGERTLPCSDQAHHTSRSLILTHPALGPDTRFEVTTFE